MTFQYRTYLFWFQFHWNGNARTWIASSIGIEPKNIKPRMSRGHKPVGFDTALTTRDINAICIYVMELGRMRIIKYKWFCPCILLFVISLVWKVNGLHIACVKQSVHGPEIARAMVPAQGLQGKRPAALNALAANVWKSQPYCPLNSHANNMLLLVRKTNIKPQSMNCCCCCFHSIRYISVSSFCVS